MFNKPTVFIIGAGASAECGLPTGSQLKEQIRSSAPMHAGEPSLYKILQGCVSDVAPYMKAGRELSETLATFPSIDEALHWWRANPETVFLGKLAIAYHILVAERSSPLRPTLSMDVDVLSKTWFSSFLSIALSGLEREQAERAFEKVTIINFNYDRSIEHYLYAALLSRAAVSVDTARRCIAGLRVIRPYGSIGKLEWQGQFGVPFGADDASAKARQMADNIRTFTEQIEDVTVLGEIREAFESAHLVIFLGFGFHQQNLELLKPQTHGTARPLVRAVLATTRGIDEKNNPMIADYLHDDLGLRLPPKLFPYDAGELLAQLRPTIT